MEGSLRPCSIIVQMSIARRLLLRTILRQGVPVCEVLVQWEHLPLEDASWEPWDDALIDGLEDKAVSHGEGNVTKIQPEANSSQQPVDVSDGVVTRPKCNLRMPTRLLD
ncbi:hypothetical protein Pint_07331 [Pistacia integerrima]|uniref:Uncharacterized protein n=1 Tax=Pistacia integerrima TaxID=434235 RepID=A0ACC0XVW5_9ROSI|nr:hypothetical protein Pint_07331 [Pistacia integerrima]